MLFWPATGAHYDTPLIDLACNWPCGDVVKLRKVTQITPSSKRHLPHIRWGHNVTIIGGERADDNDLHLEEYRCRKQCGLVAPCHAMLRHFVYVPTQNRTKFERCDGLWPPANTERKCAASVDEQSDVAHLSQFSAPTESRNLHAWPTLPSSMGRLPFSRNHCTVFLRSVMADHPVTPSCWSWSARA